jgi:glutathione S-transferase
MHKTAAGSSRQSPTATHLNPPIMKLYVDSQYASPWAMCAFVALCEKGVEFETVPVDLAAGEQRRPDYAALSLTRRVPTLLDGDFALAESTAIAEYLEDTRPGVALYPADARLRARARQLQAWLRSDLVPIRQERTTEVIFYGRPAAPLSETARAATEGLYAAAEGLLGDASTSLFGAWSIADTDLALMLNRLRMAGDPMPAALARYAQHHWQRPSVQRWVQRRRPPL